MAPPSSGIEAGHLGGGILLESDTEGGAAERRGTGRQRAVGARHPPRTRAKPSTPRGPIRVHPTRSKRTLSGPDSVVLSILVGRGNSNGNLKFSFASLQRRVIWRGHSTGDPRHQAAWSTLTGPVCVHLPWPLSSPSTPCPLTRSTGSPDPNPCSFPATRPPQLPSLLPRSLHTIWCPECHPPRTDFEHHREVRFRG